MDIRIVIRIKNYAGMSELMAPKSIRSLLKLNLVPNFKTSHSVLLWTSVNCTDIAPPEQDHLEEMGVQETSLQCECWSKIQLFVI